MKAFDISGKRKAAGVKRQEDLVKELGWPHKEPLSMIEDGRIGIDDETYSEITSAIDRLAARNREAVSA